MATAISFASPIATGGVALSKKYNLRNGKLKSLSGGQSQLAVPQRSKPLKRCSVRAEYSDDSRGGGDHFVAGFLLGGAIFGTLAYAFAPQIRRTLRNEDEHGFARPRRIYYGEDDDDALEKTRRTLNAKIKQLNNAIDNVYIRLRGGNNVMRKQPVNPDSEVLGI